MVAAIKPKKKFDGYILIERKPKYCKALEKLLPNATIINGDTNSDIPIGRILIYEDYDMD